MTRTTLPEQPTPRSPRAKRSDSVSVQIRDLIVAEGLVPGDTIANERDLMDRFQASKGTVREALKALEAQGLVRISTGPGGGARVAKVPLATAARLLGNYFYFEDVSVDDLYRLRVMLEPELAALVTPLLNDDDFEALERVVAFCEPVATDRSREHDQRIAELDFHDILADRSPDPLLRFTCRFVTALIKNGVVYRTLYGSTDTAPGTAAPVDNMERMAHDGVDAHQRLLEAFRGRDPKWARREMKAHMTVARRHLRRMEATLRGGFFDH